MKSVSNDFSQVKTKPWQTAS